MTTNRSQVAADALELQRALLDGVSRTFALTIRALPPRLELVVGNAYLLCRITDTIEDATDLDAAASRAFCERFASVVQGKAEPGTFAHDLEAHLAPSANPAERHLIEVAPDVLAITRSFAQGERAALSECIAVMASGMAAFQKAKSRRGLADLPEHARYCYVVAGCVGEMLTRLFIEAMPELAERREPLMRLAVSFGQCLQMTNILKDFWEDRALGACWLPHDVFNAEGVDLARVEPGALPDGFARGYRRLIGVARAHAENALAYCLLIPAHAAGVRNFCLWALYMALLTLRKLASHPGFQSGAEVKISRFSVHGVVAFCRVAVQSDQALRAAFALLAHGLPQPRYEDLGTAPRPALLDAEMRREA